MICRMPIDYEEWEKSDYESYFQWRTRSLEALNKGITPRASELATEIGIREGQSYSFWRAGNGPTGRLENLVTLFDKVVVPIFPYRSRDAFARVHNGLRPADLISILKSAPDKFVVVITGDHKGFERLGFYDAFFEACRSDSLYGRLPQKIIASVPALMHEILCRRLASESGIRFDAGTNWQRKVLERFPEYSLDAANNEIEEIITWNPRSWADYIGKQPQAPKMTKSWARTALLNLRVGGFNSLAQSLKQSSKALCDPALTIELLECSESYLLGPVTARLCGFCNYSMRDLERMAFLRILPLGRRQLERMKMMIYRILFNSPAARSVQTVQEHKMNIFIPKNQATRANLDALNNLITIYEGNRELARRMSEYRQRAVEGDLGKAIDMYGKIGEVIQKTYNQEIKQWHATEKVGRIAKGSVAAGVTVLSELGKILASELPAQWRLTLSAAIEYVKSKAADWLRTLDSKSVVDVMLDTKNWTWYEKGVPYLLWKTEGRSDRQSD